MCNSRERILAEEGLDNSDEPASVLFNAAVKKLSATNSMFKSEFANVENKYKKGMGGILM